jgi:hypothetical protein
MSCVSVLLARSQCRTSVTNFSRILKHQNVGNFSGSSSCRSLCSSAYHEKSRQPAIRDFEVRPNILALYNLGLFPNGSRPFSTGQIRCKEEDKAVEKVSCFSVTHYQIIITRKKLTIISFIIFEEIRDC